MTEPFKDPRTRFFIQCKGDPDVGIGGCDAEVLLCVPDPEDDPEYLAFIKKQLADAFEAIWDDRVRVLTEAECDPDDHDEEMIERKGR